MTATVHGLAEPAPRSREPHHRPAHFPGDRAGAVDGISFSVGQGEILGIAGESGSGKTLTALSLLGLLPMGASTGGSVRFDGRELLGLKRRQLREVRGKQVALVSQDPATALHPLLRIDVQMTEHVRAHLGFSKEQAQARAIEMLDRRPDT